MCWGVGGMKKFWGMCGKVCCGVGKVRRDVGINVGGVGKCVGGDVGKCQGRFGGCAKACWGEV